MSAIAYPYLRPSAGTVVASAWQVSVDGRPHVPLQTEVPGWDYAASVEAIRSFSVDYNELAREVGVDTGTLAVDLLVTMSTGKGRLGAARKIVWRSRVRPDEAQDALIVLDGPDLSNRFSLTSELILRDTPFVLSTLAPHLPGTRLWSDTVTAELEPVAPRFPIEVTSFSANLRHRAGASPWFLDWSPGSLSHEFVSSVQLYLNADFPELVERVRGIDETTIRLIMAGMVVQLARGALGDESFSLSLQSEHPTSVGGVIATWISAAFPDQSLPTVQSIAQLNPSKFDSAIAALSTLAGEE